MRSRQKFLIISTQWVPLSSHFSDELRAFNSLQNWWKLSMLSCRLYSSAQGLGWLKNFPCSDLHKLLSIMSALRFDARRCSKIPVDVMLHWNVDTFAHSWLENIHRLIITRAIMMRCWMLPGFFSTKTMEIHKLENHWSWAWNFALNHMQSSSSHMFIFCQPNSREKFSFIISTNIVKGMKCWKIAE